MPSRIPQRTHPRTWIEIISNSTALYNCFTPYEEILESIGVTSDLAFNRFSQIYEEGITTYTEDYILTIFENNLSANAKKYSELVAIYQEEIDIFSPVSITESYTDTRTPNLTNTTTSTASSSSTSTRNQSQTTTTTPATTETMTHSVNPYDGTGMRQESQDINSTTGTNTSVTSYSGNPDTASGTATSSGSVSSTGTEKIEHTLSRSGRDGKFTISDIIDQAEISAAKLNILDIINNDIADQIFIQVWL